MSRRLVYIAGPYGDPDPAVRAWNVARACLLGRLSQRCGLAPVVVHPSIAAGVYGCDEVEAERAAGMESTIAVVEACDLLWGLLRDDGTQSSGTAGEVNAARHARIGLDVATWEQWRRMVCLPHAPDLLSEWDALAVRP